jgi:hypothetical protein
MTKTFRPFLRLVELEEPPPEVDVAPPPEVEVAPAAAVDAVVLAPAAAVEELPDELLFDEPH